MDEKLHRGDVVLNSNEFSWIGDKTDGKIITCVGPIKRGLQDTEVPKIWDPREKKFITTDQATSVQKMIIAPKGWYVILKNPAADNNQPQVKKANEPADLDIGIKVNIPGPATFALWPGQMTKVVEGHHLRSNQYLLCRVYDESAAMKNWSKAIVSIQKESSEPPKSDELKDGQSGDISSSDKPVASVVDIVAPHLVNGQRIVVKGTDVSFHIPPTGIEIILDENGKFVREAITLERLEYCILLDENGNKRYVRGPETVFPSPTEVFLKDSENNKKFRAIELDEFSGLHIKVIAPYKSLESDNTVTDYKEGDELFITGKEQMIYFPRQEHSIIRYDGVEKHHAVAIPSGTARYVMDKKVGKIDIVLGPAMKLLDPRKYVFIKRRLTDKEVKLWFPNNSEALVYNRSIAPVRESESSIKNVVDGITAGSPLTKSAFLVRSGVSQEDSLYAKFYSSSSDMQSMDQTMRISPEKFTGDGMERRSIVSKPSQLTLDDKYQGVIKIAVWPGYAIQIISNTGKRSTVIGPTIKYLEYDETLAEFTLSTGKVKSTDNLKSDVYLKVLANKVSDQIFVETEDLFKASIQVSYRIRFLDKFKDRWFNVDNYVQFAVDDLRSRLKAAVKAIGIEAFYTNGIEIVRDCILGPKPKSEPVAENEKEVKKERSGRTFEENGMMIYDVDIIDININDDEVESLLKDYKTTVVKGTLEVKKTAKSLENSTEVEKNNRAINAAKKATRLDLLDNEKEVEDKKAKNAKSVVENELDLEAYKLSRDEENQETLNTIATEANKRAKDLDDLKIAKDKAESNLKVEEQKGLADAKATELAAITPELTAAIQSAASVTLFASEAEHLAPLALVKSLTIGGVVEEILDGTPIGDTLKRLVAKPTR